MAKYRITGPDGGTYEITAPDDASEADILAYAQRNAGMTKAPEPQAEAAPEAPQAPEKGFLQNARETLKDSVTGVAQGATFNLADEIQGALATPIELGIGAYKGLDDGKGLGQRFSDAYTRGLERARAGLKEAEDRSPIASVVGNVAGGGMTGGAMQKGGLTLLNAAKPTVGSMVGRGAAEGALYGGAYGFGSGEGTGDRLDKALSGGALGGATGGVMGGIGAKMAQSAADKTIPSVDALKNAGTAAYKEARQAGVEVKSDAFKNAVDDIYSAAKMKGLDEGLTPDSWAALQRLRKEVSSGAPKSLEEIDLLRRVVSSAQDGPKKSDRAVAGVMKDRLDKFITSLTPADVNAGDPIKGVSALTKARDLWSKQSKADLIQTAVTKAERQAASTGAGGNLDNAIRQKIRALLDGPKAATFTKDERELMDKVVRGGTVQNLARLVGKLSPQGNGLMLLGHVVGGVSSGGATLPAAGVGYAAKKFADSATPRNVDALSRLIRSGGQLPQPQQLTAAQQAALGGITRGVAQQRGLLD